ncbi:flagellar biosynthetic protein FliO [Vibrio sp. RC27]
MKWMIIGLLPLPAMAASTAPQFDIAASFGALILVIVFILFLAWMLKKMRLPMLGAQSDLSVVRQLPVGTKERVMVIQAGEEQFLVGVTTQSIQLISKLETPISTTKEKGDAPKSSFAQQLNQVIKRHDK